MTSASGRLRENAPANSSWSAYQGERAAAALVAELGEAVREELGHVAVSEDGPPATDNELAQQLEGLSQACAPPRPGARGRRRSATRAGTCEPLADGANGLDELVRLQAAGRRVVDGRRHGGVEDVHVDVHVDIVDAVRLAGPSWPAAAAAGDGCQGGRQSVGGRPPAEGQRS